MRDFQFPGRSTVHAENGICASSHPLATGVGLEILKDGGNAMDAAIACAVVLGLCEPQSTGIGGDCFVLFKPAGSEDIHALNGSGKSPGGLNAARLRAEGHEKIDIGSPHSVTIPGAIDAFCKLSEDWGRKGIDASLAPAIHYAQNGVVVSPRASFDWVANTHRIQGDAAKRWYLANGTAPKLGSIWDHQGQAEVLRRIARDGARAFYEGEIADDMVTSLQALGGTHCLDDFAAVSSEYTRPISGMYKQHELVEHPPNGQGATAILMAKILGHFDLENLDPWGLERAHLEAEAAKLAHDARDRFIADPEHTKRLNHMISDVTAQELASLIDPKRAMVSARKASGAVHKDTVYLSVVDRDRMAVSMIYSTYYAFGSGLASDKFGILFQNRGAGFTLEEGHPNEAGPHKRSLHTIIPGMLRKGGKVLMPFGVMGGSYQPTGHVRVMTNMLDYGMDVQEALDGPRSFADDGKVALERGYSDEVLAGMEQLGHNCHRPASPLGGGQAIWIDHENGTLVGGSDPRKDGSALGY